MSDKEGKLFELRSEDIPLGAFAVILLPQEIKAGDDVRISECEIIFEGAGNLAGDLIGQGIATQRIDSGDMIGLVLNPDEPWSLTEKGLPDHVDDGF